MGTWSAESFKNDAALDWLGDLLETSNASLVDDAFAHVLDHDGFKRKSFLGINVQRRKQQLPADLAAKAIAAAEIVAARFGNPAEQLPKQLPDWITKHASSFDHRLIEKALESLTKIKSNSELSDLWNEGDNTQWKDAVNNLEARLRASKASN